MYHYPNAKPFLLLIRNRKSRIVTLYFALRADSICPSTINIRSLVTDSILYSIRNKVSVTSLANIQRGIVFSFVA